MIDPWSRRVRAGSPSLYGSLSPKTWLCEWLMNMVMIEGAEVVYVQNGISGGGEVEKRRWS